MKPQGEAPNLENARCRRIALRQVYFIEAASLGLVKIGVAKRSRHRLRNLQIGSPAKLSLRGCIYTDDPHRLERAYHKAWSANRQHGEWFRVDEDMEAFMREALWPPDDPLPRGRIIFNPENEPKRGRVAYISDWCLTTAERVQCAMRQLAAPTKAARGIS